MSFDFFDQKDDEKFEILKFQVARTAHNERRVKRREENKAKAIAVSCAESFPSGNFFVICYKLCTE